MKEDPPQARDQAHIPEDVVSELAPIAREAAGRRTGFQDQNSIDKIELLSFQALADAVQVWKQNPQEKPPFIKLWLYETTLSIAEHFMVPQLEKVAYKAASSVLNSAPPETISEIVRQTLETYFTYIPKWDQSTAVLPSNVTSWTWRVAKNNAIKWVKGEESLLPLTPEENPAMTSVTADIVLEQRETRAALLQLLRIMNEEILPTLSEEDKLVWNQYYLDCNSAERMSKLLGIDPSSVRRKWFRLILKVRDALEPKIREVPVLDELFSRVVEDPKSFLGLAVLSRLLRSEGPAAVNDLAESFCTTS